jgi:hypothetical protein
MSKKAGRKSCNENEEEKWNESNVKQWKRK